MQKVTVAGPSTLSESDPALKIPIQSKASPSRFESPLSAINSVMWRAPCAVEKVHRLRTSSAPVLAMKLAVSNESICDTLFCSPSNSHKWKPPDFVGSICTVRISRNQLHSKAREQDGVPLRGTARISTSDRQSPTWMRIAHPARSMEMEFRARSVWIVSSSGTPTSILSRE